MIHEIEVYVNLKEIEKRYNSLQKITGNKVAPVIKNNCNQLGFIKMFEFFKGLGCKTICCSYARELLKVADDDTVWKMAWNWRPDEEYAKIKKLMLVCKNKEQIEFCLKHNIKYFVCFNLGMARGGFTIDDIPNIDFPIENILTHCPHPTLQGLDIYEKQVFELLDILKNAGYNIKEVSAGNTLVTMMKPSLRFDYCRVGGGLVMPNYGYGAEPKNYKPLEVKTYISSIEEVKALNYVGYDFKCIEKDSITAIIPVGYYTFNTPLKRVLVHTKSGDYKCEVIAPMHDTTVIDVSGIPDIKMYDEVTIAGPEVLDDNLNQGPHRTFQFNPDLAHYNYIY